MDQTLGNFTPINLIKLDPVFVKIFTLFAFVDIFGGLGRTSNPGYNTDQIQAQNHQNRPNPGPKPQNGQNGPKRPEWAPKRPKSSNMAPKGPQKPK